MFASARHIHRERHRKLHSRKYIVAVGIAEESVMEYALPEIKRRSQEVFLANVISFQVCQLSKRPWEKKTGPSNLSEATGG